MAVHVAIVSDQTLPNLIPILMERPKKAFLVASQQMLQKEVAERLKRVTEEEGVPAEIIPGMPDSGFPQFLEFARTVAGRLLEQEHPVVFNATGGNKLMMLAFVDVFREVIPANRLRIIYTDTATGKLETV